MIRITTLIVASLTTIATTSALAINSLCEAVALHGTALMQTQEREICHE
jgi:hypothetical protein